jgi:hypothetical protein
VVPVSIRAAVGFPGRAADARRPRHRIFGRGMYFFFLLFSLLVRLG